MMSSPGFEIVVIVLIILCNSLFAVSEMAIVAARKSLLRQRARQGDRRAQAALDLSEHPGDFLSTVQIGITLSGILAGAFGGATVAERLTLFLARSAALAPYSRVIALAIVVIVVTYLSLVVGELVPKRLALNHPEKLAVVVARPMRFVSLVISPVVRILTVSTNALLRLINIGPTKEPPVSDDEIKDLFRVGVEAGVFTKHEGELVSGVLRLGDRRVGSFMTPRIEMYWLDPADPPEEVRRKVAESGHSRFPVGDGGLDNVIGIVEAKKIVLVLLDRKPLDLRNIMTAPIFIPETTRAAQILDMFHETGVHMALVVDEYGGTQGLVTLHDIVNIAVGDITSPPEHEEPMAVRRHDGSWLIDGRISAEDFRTLLGVKELPGEKAGAYETMGGFVMMRFGRIPVSGDRFRWKGLEFEVVDMDARRVDKILVKPGAAAGSGIDDSAQHRIDDPGDDASRG